MIFAIHPCKIAIRKIACITLIVIYLCTPYLGSFKQSGVSIRTRFFGFHGVDVIRVIYKYANFETISPVDTTANVHAMTICVQARIKPAILFCGNFCLTQKKKQHDKCIRKKFKLDENSKGLI